MAHKDFLLFAGNSHLGFARAIARQLGVVLHEPDESDRRGPTIKWFSNGNVLVDPKINVRGKHCFVIQTQAPGRALIFFTRWESCLISDFSSTTTASSPALTIPMGIKSRIRSMLGIFPDDAAIADFVPSINNV